MPSTGISTMALARSIPDWGLALGWLSIFTAITLRSSRSASSTGRPLIGEVGSGRVVVVALDVLVVEGRAVVLVVTIVVAVVVVVSAVAVQAATKTARITRSRFMNGRCYCSPRIRENPTGAACRRRLSGPLVTASLDQTRLRPPRTGRWGIAEFG